MTLASPTTAAVPEPMLPRPFRVVNTNHETPDTVTLVLESLTDEPTSFMPGQFMMIYVFGVGEVPISIAGNPRMPGMLVHTVRAVGAVTNAICDLAVGDVVGARGPYGTGWPLDQAMGRDLLIVAGGIGLAPLRPAVIDAIGRRHDFSSVSLVYGARTPSDLIYKDDLLGWSASPDISLEVTVDRALSDWRGDVGLVTGLLLRIDFSPSATTAFVCGPEVMMRVVARELKAAGLSPDEILVSVERNMKCAVGFCGHCQYGSDFICRTGPIGSYARFATRLHLDEI